MILKLIFKSVVIGSMILELILKSSVIQYHRFIYGFDLKLNLNGFINVLKVKIQRNKYWIQPCYFDWICNISFSVFTYMISFCRYLISCLLVNMSYFVPHFFLSGSQINPHLFFTYQQRVNFFSIMDLYE